MKLKTSSAKGERSAPLDVREFDEFVKRQQGLTPGVTELDWDNERKEWLKYLDKLYKKIESLLSKYISSGQIQLEYGTVELNEENIGSYSAQDMVLKIGRQSVNVEPIGTLFLGSKGRVDIIGPGGRAQLMLVDSKRPGPKPLVQVSIGFGGKRPVPPAEPSREIKWEWRIVTRPPERRFIEITQQTLFQLIMEVANG
jgi:hypothetical protein